MMTMEIAIQKSTTDKLTIFNDLVLEYQDQVYTQAYRILGEHKSAEDVTQDAFLIAFRKFHMYRGGSMKAWLLRIVTNLCYSELRKQRKRWIVPLEPTDQNEAEFESPYWLQSPEKSPEETVEEYDCEDLIQRRICELPDHNRIALILVDIQGLNYAEAASVIGCPVGTLKSRLARGRIQLRYRLRSVLK